MLGAAPPPKHIELLEGNAQASRRRRARIRFRELDQRPHPLAGVKVGRSGVQLRARLGIESMQLCVERGRGLGELPRKRLDFGMHLWRLVVAVSVFVAIVVCLCAGARVRSRRGLILIDCFLFNCVCRDVTRPIVLGRGHFVQQFGRGFGACRTARGFRM